MRTVKVAYFPGKISSFAGIAAKREAPVSMAKERGSREGSVLGDSKISIFCAKWGVTATFEHRGAGG
jgi:hypothetical protein